MRVSEVMTRHVEVIDPGQPIQKAAQCMCDMDVGALPVGENDRLVGMITDRDIAVRAVALGKSADTPVREVMSSQVCYCFEDEEVAAVADNMANKQIRRLPVLSRAKRMVGILTLGDLAVSEEGSPMMQKVGQALAGISHPGGAHSQTDDRINSH
ncbi:CBS domain-containing protein [Bradyrhizobium sp. LHD-71]|uniref:CBS domain-containing protein n=1 Tax=Bradyrhizobium sp. LHD-71 TaxID=3072141 RepID=UPI00280DF105|nr:CBS domain-containing protein [Bradyrhizobium sp. LHD-71]MDQ8729372.1 CBS domain-containing protein [Bradyrhizobium sp. LHD-71]